MTNSLLPELHSHWQWPSTEHILRPPGAGAAFYQRLAYLKIEKPLSRLLGKDQVRVNVLVGDPAAETSDPPIALLCEFSRALPPEHLRKTRALAWNFCRTPLLITLEPQLLRIWSCYEKPDAQGNFPDNPVDSCGDGTRINLSALADTLNWSRLASGQFLERHANRFDRNQRADSLLLENLQYIRERLTRTFGEEKGLGVGTAHDLLARVVFVQFLMQRTDSEGRTALNKEKLNNLHKTGILSKLHDDLSSILNHKDDTFALFEWLNGRFNGDLFPRDYSAEKKEVKSSHLGMLADFVGGRLQMEKGQCLLWPYYSFDTIPLEFISSIYEEFVTKRDDGEGIGEHYTRPFLVDFMLDKVLPWNGTEYDLKILDPCCGSAVFLVKSFQRLVQRWRNAHPNQNPDASFLRGLLENNLFGVDTNKDAVRVASFSLYLAMCDEIDPKHYWTQVRFPSLRDKRICTADFFSETLPGIRTREDKGLYDLVVGNAPWGADSLTPDAKAWAADKNNGPWPIADKQSGTLFLAKAARLCKTDGRICMIQPAGALLFNISGPAKKFRRKLFAQYKVDEVTNLSALRFLKIFPEAVGPACIINMRPVAPDGEAIAYWSPKHTNNQENGVRVVLDEEDLNWVWPEEAADDPVVWPALTWGGRRDRQSIYSLLSRHATLRSRTEQGKWHVGRGFQRGQSEAKTHLDTVNCPILECPKTKPRLSAQQVLKKYPPVCDVTSFPLNKDPKFERKRNWIEYTPPLLILPESWTAEEHRFACIYVRAKGEHSHLQYSQSFYGIQGPSPGHLAVLGALLRSSLCVYFYYLTSGRLTSYRPTLRKEDMLRLPLPNGDLFDLGRLEQMPLTDLDSFVYDLMQMNAVERALVEEFMELTLPAFKSVSTHEPLGRTKAWLAKTSCATLDTYSDWFLRVLKSAFGSDKSVCATIFQPPDPGGSPFCMVGIHLDWERSERIRHEEVSDGNLLEVLAHCAQDDLFESLTTQTEALYYRRVSRIYQTLPVKEHRKQRKVPTVFLIKPNEIRYWTRSAALRDADNVVADLLKEDRPTQFERETSLG